MIKNFFTDIFPSDTSYKLIWTLRDKKSHWFQNTNLLIEYVQESKDNTFFGIGVTDKKLSQYKRATARDITSIGALHLDIDIFDPIAHKSESLPKTFEEAHEMAHSILEPTWIINSGHGFQPHYCFNEPQQVDDFDYWTLIGQAWQRAHAAKFPQYTLDATHDLSRVLRCPGTTNSKNRDKIVPCEIIEHNENAYYEKEEIEDAIGFNLKDAISHQAFSIKETRERLSGSVLNTLKRLTVVQSKEYIQSHGITFDETRSIPSDTFMNIQSMEPVFFDEYQNKTGRDSASEYQMKLTYIAVKCGLNDQDVIDLLVQHRRHNNYNMDMDRPDKYINDILKAKKTYNIEASVQKKNDSLTTDELEDIRSYLRSRLQIQIYKVWRYDKDPDVYFELELANHPNKIVHLGSMGDGIMNQKNFISKVSARVLEAPQRIDNKYWYPDIVKKLLKLVVDGESAETATYEGQVRVWAREYFIDKDIEPNLDTFLESGVFSVPFYHNDRIYFSFEIMALWIKTNKGQNIDAFHFGIAMTKNGFIQDQIRTNNGGILQLWGTPPGYVNDSIGESI